MLNSATSLRPIAPVSISGISNAIAISAWASHSCALLIHGSVRCWGENHDNQLGNGFAAVNPAPVTLPAFSSELRPSPA